MTQTAGDRPRLRHGGLMRCCTGTWHELAERGDLPTDVGEKVQCTYSDKPDHRMVLAADGVWEWSNDDS